MIQPTLVLILLMLRGLARQSLHGRVVQVRQRQIQFYQQDRRWRGVWQSLYVMCYSDIKLFFQ